MSEILSQTPEEITAFCRVSTALTIIFVSHFAVSLFMSYMRKHMNLPNKKELWGVRANAIKSFPAPLMGIIERFAIAIIWTLSIESAFVFGAFWIAAKMASHWQRRETKSSWKERAFVSSSQLALVSSLLSLSLGIAAGIALDPASLIPATQSCS